MQFFITALVVPWIFCPSPVPAPSSSRPRRIMIQNRVLAFFSPPCRDFRGRGIGPRKTSVKERFDVFGPFCQEVGVRRPEDFEIPNPVTHTAGEHTGGTGRQNIVG